MASFERFEDLDIWKLSKDVANQVYDITSTGKFSQDYVLRYQVRRGLYLFSQISPKDLKEKGIRNFCSFYQSQKPLAAKFALN